MILNRLSECVQELHDMDNPIILRPETMGKPGLIGSLEDVLYLARNIDGVKPCLDFPHIHARSGGTSHNSYESWSKLLTIYGKSLGNDALSDLHIHMSGIKYSTKGELKHLPLRDSDFDVLSLFKALKYFNCKGRILCESPILEEDALYMQALWETIQ